MITEAQAVIRAWLSSYWPRKSRARELGRQYALLREECPHALADLMRFCLMYDTTFVAGDPELSQLNVGKREVALHIKNMVGLTDDDLAHLQEETERE